MPRQLGLGIWGTNNHAMNLMKKPNCVRLNSCLIRKHRKSLRGLLDYLGTLASENHAPGTMSFRIYESRMGWCC